MNNISKKKKEEKKEEEQKSLETMIMVLFSLIVVITIVGNGFYLVEKYNEYGSSFSLNKFILGVPVCKNYTPANAKLNPLKNL